MKRRILLGLTVIVVLVLVAGVTYLMRDPVPRFLERRSAIAGVTPGTPVLAGESSIQPVRLSATSGLTVEIAVRRHRADTVTGQRLPLVVILDGNVTAPEAARLVGEKPGVIIATLAYPFTGDPLPRSLALFGQIPAIRNGIHDTPPAIMLALDYLLRQPGVDPNRVEAVGVSLGAPFITIAGALDRRVTRVWAIHGYAGSRAQLSARMRSALPSDPLRRAAAAVADGIIGGPRLAPEKWVSRIAPRRFIMINARDDDRMPREAVDALYQSAADPKEMIWMPGGRVRPGSLTLQQLIDIVVARVRAG